ncbi:hypothetical protein GCM10023195_70870 [Actinoallomurus liliacearum]|uniref:NERD domain-containing protein n=2 Tax=Actinoallomurus liliacearum TaxID=1080073 RepID=A0ABP8TVA7_9ACTN
MADSHKYIDDREGVTDMSKWANTTARLIEWSHRYGNQSRTSARTPTKRVIDTAFELAWNWDAIDIALQGVRAGRVRLLAHGNALAVEPLSDPSIEALDIVLEKIDTANTEENTIGPSLAPAHDYFRAQEGRRSVYMNIPHWIAGLYVQHMKNYVAQRHWDVPADTDLGGLKVGDAIPLIGTLKGISFLQYTLFQGEPSPKTAYLGMESHTLAKSLRRYNPNNTAIDAFIEMLTYKPGRSPLSAPIIPWCGKLIIPFFLMSDGLEERMVLRAAASNPSTAGRLGESLGALCRRWADRLKSIPGTRVATEVKVLAANRRKIGDLDIVVLDADQKTGLIIEAKWPIDARTLPDAWKQEAAIDKGRSQIVRLKKAITEGALVKLPLDWPPFADIEWKWLVGTSRYLDSRISHPDIDVTSLRFVEQLLPVTSTTELIHKLTTFPYPKEGHEFRLNWRKFKIGDTTVKCREIEMLQPEPSPPAERNRAKGWT